MPELISQTFLKRLVLLLSVVACCNIAMAAEGNPSDWNGTWLAQGTLFSVGVTVENDVFVVSEVQSLGFVWTSGNGRVAGNQATLEVRYAGVSAVVLARLTGDGTAVAETLSCAPEFMVVCTLARGRQAVFIRQDR